MKSKVLILFCSGFLFFSFCGYAQKNSKLSLSQIDRLIKNTEYQEALIQINDYLQENPNDFDNAQKRIKKIMESKEEYSDITQIFIEIIQNNPKNSKKLYEMMQQVDKAKKNPPEKNVEFMDNVRKSVEFSYNRSLFLEIQKESGDFTKRKLYIAALNKIKGGFWIYQKEFYEKWENEPRVIKKMDSLTERLNVQLEILLDNNYLSQINEKTYDFAKVVNSKNMQEIQKEYENIKKIFVQHAQIRNDIFEIKNEMEQLYEEIYGSNFNDASYIPFMVGFITGEKDIEYSGILGCYDFAWNSFVKNLNDSVFTVIQDYYNQYVLYLNDENLVEVYNCLSQVEQYFDLQKDILNLYELLNQSETEKIVNPLDYYFVLGETLNTLCKNTLKIYELYDRLNKQLIEQKSSLDEKLKSNTAFDNNLVENLHDLTVKVSEVTGDKDDYNLNNFEWFLEYKRLKKDLWNTLLRTYDYMVDKVFTQAEEMQLELWTQIALIYEKNTQLFINQSDSVIKASQKYLSGFSQKIPQNDLVELYKSVDNAIEYANKNDSQDENDFGIIYCYADLAEMIMSNAKNDIDSNKKSLEKYILEIKNNYSRDKSLNSADKISGLFADTLEYLETQNKKLAEIQKVINDNLALARNKLIQSKVAKNEADLRFTEAENALKRNDFEVARKKLQDSLKKYDESLSLQNDENLRSECDKKLYDLSMRIAKEENEVVVKEVRELKNLAKDAYFNGRFEDAEKYLNQAKARWAVTNDTADAEITNLSNFVNAAISMKTGRDIPYTAPQYPEMSQLLNVAYKYFDEGSHKISEGKNEEGFKDLEIALENIHKLQLVYPLNQEASILTLKINRLKNPKKFADELEQKINAAKLMCENPKTRKEGYANLLDYYELEPSYKGLKDLIYKVEIDIGIRQKEVDNSGIKKANQLLSEAQKIYQNAGNDEKKLKQALDKIDESLNLVMDNPAAIKLKDEITTKIGGTVITVLSTEDERLYQLAVQRLQANNVIGANMILQKILETPGNASLQKVQDLKNKIEVRS